MIYYIPIEPFELRYTEDWYSWFPIVFGIHRIPYRIIDGKKITDKIETGRFLDVCGTNHYKASQIQEISRLIYQNCIKDSHVFLFADGWFPGIESLAYMRDALGKNFKIYGIFHAGTYDVWDYLTQCGMASWGRELENSWFKIFDGIFVATEYHRDLITSERKIDPCKVHVTGLPFYKKPEFENPVEKEHIVVFPHRLDPEKQPEIFDRMAEKFKDKYPAWKFVKTIEICNSKQEYYEVLRKSMISVSCALQETWGIAMLESVCAGCVPLVPDRLSYSEMYPDHFKYQNFFQSLEHIISLLEYPASFLCPRNYWNEKVSIMQEKILEEGCNAIPNMLRVMGFLP